MISRREHLVGLGVGIVDKLDPGLLTLLQAPVDDADHLAASLRSRQ